MSYEPLIKWSLKYGPSIMSSSSEDDIEHSPEIFNLVCRVSYIDRRGWTDSAKEQFQLNKYLSQVYEILTKNVQKITVKKVIISLQKNRSLCSDLITQIIQWLHPQQSLDLFLAVEMSKNI